MRLAPAPNALGRSVREQERVMKTINRTDGSRLELAVGGASRSLAGRFSRRSFIGRLGLGVVAASLGESGLSLMRPGLAGATIASCGTCSVSCNYLPGWLQNSCPTNSCRCGHWCFTDSTCPSGQTRRWTDCCDLGWCGAHGGCYCVTSKNKVTCCNSRTYSPYDCNPSGAKVVCRFNACNSGCSGIPNYC
jgi:hypothetical protein